MISCVEWVPQGVADPHPKAHELSAAEKELLENQAQLEAAALDPSDGTDDDDDDSDKEQVATNNTSIVLPKVDPRSLPSELRMDEYSSDEDDEDDNNNVMQGSAIGKLLVGNDADDMQEEDHVIQEEDSSDSDVDSDDDLEDIPDTREYVPTDVEGLQAMGLSHVGAGAAMNLDDDGDDDDSDIDDTDLLPDDAIIVVAKTEEVSALLCSLDFLLCDVFLLTTYFHLVKTGLCFIGSSRL